MKRRLKVGEEVTGVIIHKVNFGYFIDLGDEAVGLLEKIEMPDMTTEQWNTEENPEGSPVKAIIFRFDDANHQVRLTKVPERDWKETE